jgi:hypothetical protein
LNYLDGIPGASKNCSPPLGLGEAIKACCEFDSPLVFHGVLVDIVLKFRKNGDIARLAVRFWVCVLFAKYEFHHFPPLSFGFRILRAAVPVTDAAIIPARILKEQD